MNRIQPETSLPREKAIKVYTALLNQSGTTAPTTSILQNDIGEIAWTYDSVGVYIANSDELFTPEEKLYMAIESAGKNTIYRIDETQIAIQTYDTAGTPANGQLYYTPVEIKIYS